VTHLNPIRIRPLVGTALALSLLAACSRQPSAPAPANQPAPATAASPASQAPGAGQGPSAEAATEPRTITGTVTETMNAANYTYVRIKTGREDLWIASGKFKVAVGDRVVVPLEMRMDNFHSPSLKRDFPLIYFTTRVAREGESLPPAMPPGHGAMAGAPAGQSTGPVTEKVAPAEGGITVAAVWTTRSALAGKTVTVRGKVVKFNGGILGRNWMHIQDGSGSTSDGTNDLTVTSEGAAKVGDVVTVTGTIALNKDFGAGYSYEVILEGAKIVVK
jgi:hypothetical protein